MEGYTQTPPDGLWEAVEAGLPGKRAAFPWWWALAGAAAAVAAVFMLWNPSVPKQNALLADKDQVEIAVPEEVDAPESVESLLVADETALTEPRQARRSTGTLAASGRAASTGNAASSGNAVSYVSAASTGNSVSSGDAASSGDDVKVSPDNAMEPSGNQDATVIVADTESVDNKQIAADEPVGGQENADPFASIPEISVKKKKHTPVLTASLMAGGVPGGSVNNYTTYGMLSTVNNTYSYSDGGRASMALVPLLSRNKATDTEERHSVALRIGAIFNLSFSEHWGAETGLQLSNLQTQTKSVTGDMTAVTDKTISYLGIPLLAVYTPLRLDRFSLYTSAGPTFEYGFRSFGKQEHYINSEKLDEERISGKENDFILSLGLNLGAQWNVSEVGGLFVQPGLSWHLAGEGNNKTFYTEHPLSFAIAAGFRFTF